MKSETLKLMNDAKALVSWLTTKQGDHQQMSKLYYEYTDIQLPNYDLVPEEQKDLFWKFARVQFKEFINKNSPM